MTPKLVLVGGAAGAGIGAIIGHQYKKGPGTGVGAIIGGILGAIAGGLSGYKNPANVSGSKTITLMVWFDKQIVKDYSIVSTKF